jgi:GRIM-19 protein
VGFLAWRCGAQAQAADRPPADLRHCSCLPRIVVAYSTLCRRYSYLCSSFTRSRLITSAVVQQVPWAPTPSPPPSACPLQSVKDMPVLQDMPPVGGFPSIRIQRRLPSTGPTGVALFAVGAAVMAYGYYNVRPRPSCCCCCSCCCLRELYHTNLESCRSHCNTWKAHNLSLPPAAVHAHPSTLLCCLPACLCPRCCSLLQVYHLIQNRKCVRSCTTAHTHTLSLQCHCLLCLHSLIGDLHSQSAALAVSRHVPLSPPKNTHTHTLTVGLVSLLLPLHHIWVGSPLQA